MLKLTPIEYDALVEIFNIGVGQAASVMSQMVHEAITLAVPEVSILTGAEAAAELENASGVRISCVGQKFTGAFSGEALLIFPQESSLEVVRSMIGSSIPLSQLTELEQDALTEVGNIIINACLSQLSDLFEQHFDTDPPELRTGTSVEVIGPAHMDGPVMFLHIRFQLAQRQVQGYIAFLLNAPSLRQLQEAITRFLGGVPGLGGDV